MDQESPKPNLTQRAGAWVESRLVGWGWDADRRGLFWHLAGQVQEQCVAVLSISALQLLVLAIFFQQGPKDAGLQAMGLALAIVGLLLFMEGLRVLIMPLAELVGRELPRRLSLFWTLVVAFFVGVLVTYAEPAIGALKPLAEATRLDDAPYLFYVMNQKKETLVLTIGLGVGAAAVVGTLRFIKGWTLKPLIAATLAPTVGCAAWMHWGNPALRPLLGLAWDCGAVTTGPVTVPILLALGIGVMQSQRRKSAAVAALHAATDAGAGNALEGFGIVTLASLFPILAVEILVIGCTVVYSEDEIMTKSRELEAARGDPDPWHETSPWQEGVNALRSIAPLFVALALIIRVVLRVPLPELTWGLAAEAAPEPPAGGKRAGVGAAGGAQPGADGALPSGRDAELRRVSSAVADAAVVWDAESGRTSAASGGTAASPKGATPKASAAGDALAVAVGAGAAPPAPDAPPKKRASKLLIYAVSLALCQVGMLCFNEGLTYGFRKLGDQTGSTLPTGFLEVAGEPDSPRFASYAGGLVLTLATLLALGVLATRAEPALKVTGRTVEKLSGGAFTSAMLIGAVCAGVGVGMAAGAAKILYELPVIAFILSKYAAALALTYFTDDTVAAVAWDSAGVTTGPVTVPFVLAIGIGFSRAAGSAEGFGMLTIMSAAPIIAVLVLNLARVHWEAIRRALGRRGAAA